VKRALWSAALIVGLLWPGHALCMFDGLPLDGVAEASLIGVAVPLLWLLVPQFLDQRLVRVGIVSLLALKIAGSWLLTQEGWCASRPRPRFIIAC